MLFRPASSLFQAACQGSKLLHAFLQQHKQHPLSSLLISMWGKSIHQALQCSLRATCKLCQDISMTPGRSIAPFLELSILRSTGRYCHVTRRKPTSLVDAPLPMFSMLGQGAVQTSAASTLSLKWSAVSGCLQTVHGMLATGCTWHTCPWQGAGAHHRWQSR